MTRLQYVPQALLKRVVEISSLDNLVSEKLGNFVMKFHSIEGFGTEILGTPVQVTMSWRMGDVRP